MYFPKSQIEPNLYTNGEEYVLFTTKLPYKGYYYKTSKGSAYTGKTPQDGPSILLIINPYATQEDISSGETISGEPPRINYVISNVENDSITNQYYSLNPQSQNRSIPQYNPTIPTQQNKDLGVFSRYFCKKTNELIYLEINQKTFNQLQSRDPKIAWDLYIPLTTLWYIKGDKEKTYKANKGLIGLIEQNQKWYGFSKYLKEDFLKYYSA